MRGFTLIEIILVVGILAILLGLAISIPAYLSEKTVERSAISILRTLINRARVEAVARRHTTVLRFSGLEGGRADPPVVYLIILGDNPEEDKVLDTVILPEGTTLSRENFPLNMALNEAISREGSPLDGQRAYLAFDRSGALVSLSSAEVRCNLRVVVDAGDIEECIDLCVVRATGALQETHAARPLETVPVPIEFLGLDTVTRGDWQGNYGESGMILCNYYSGTVVEGKESATYDVTKTYDFSKLPDYVADYEYTYNDASTAVASWGAFAWGDEIMKESSEHDMKAGLLRPDGARMSSSVLAADPKNIQVVFTLRDRGEHRLSIYATENTASGRRMTVLLEALDEEGRPTGETTRAECTADEYLRGVWFRFRIAGSVRVTLKNQSSTMFKANTFVSGFFFDENYDSHP